jgi:hypothetical protein
LAPVQQISLDLVLPDHLRQGEAELGGAHGAGEGDHHFSALVDMGAVAISGINYGRSIEMPEVMFEKLSNGSLFHAYHPIKSLVQTKIFSLLMDKNG